MDGYGLGAMLALELALRAPLRVRRLVLCAGGPPLDAAAIAAWVAPRLEALDEGLSMSELAARLVVHAAGDAALPEGLDEVLFLNERGEVCDGSITTVFFDRGEGMRTPPLSSGLLPGVLRAELACPEEVLRAEDLSGVRLWVGNALRGLIPAVWVG